MKIFKEDNMNFEGKCTPVEGEPGKAHCIVKLGGDIAEADIVMDPKTGKVVRVNQSHTIKSVSPERSKLLNQALDDYIYNYSKKTETL